MEKNVEHELESTLCNVREHHQHNWSPFGVKLWRSRATESIERSKKITSTKIHELEHHQHFWDGIWDFSRGAARPAPRPGPK